MRDGCRFEVADSRQVPWLSCRLEEWVRRFGASLPMRMTASWFRSLDLPHTRLWRDSTAPESGLPSDYHPDCSARSRQDEAWRDRTKNPTMEKNASPCLTQKAPYKGLGARVRRESRA